MARARATVAKKVAAKQSAAVAVDDERLDAGAAEGSEAAYERFLSAAQAVTGEVIAFRADIVLAISNVRTGLAAVSPHMAQLRKELPAGDWKAVEGVLDLALGTAFAVRAVDRHSPSPGTLGQRISRAAELRDALLTNADGLAKTGLVPAREVERIRQGRGRIDMAQDCIDLAALFRKYAAAVRGKTPVSAAMVKEAAQVGSELLTELKPAGSTKKKQLAPGVTDAVALRDRFWTLLTRHHRELRRFGMWLWVDEVDAHVPALQSRTHKAKSAKTPKPVAPASTTPPTT